MTLTSNILRSINTPTVMEEYAADQEGYDQMLDAPATLALSREHDQVTGNEDLYRILLSRVASTGPSGVSGNESFIETIKKGAAAGIQAVKDFFKWLWNFFTGKIEISKRKSETLSEGLIKHGVKDGDITYPSSVGWINDKKGLPDGNLNWMNNAIADCSKAIVHTDSYLKLIKAFCNVAGGLMSADKQSALEEAYKSFLISSRTTFSLPSDGSTVKLFGTHKIGLGSDGKFKQDFVVPMFNAKTPPKFKTDRQTVNGLLEKVGALTTDLDKLLKDATELESVFIKVLNNSAKSAGEGNKTTVDLVQSAIRASMVNIKTLQSTFFKGNAAALDILTGCVKGAK